LGERRHEQRQRKEKTGAAKAVRVFSGLAVVCVAIAFQAMAQAAEKPNIILIMADDLGYGSLGCYGSEEIKTPNIDRLAAGGMRFTDFHSNGTLCTPTRAALLTGRYQQRCAWVDDGDLSPVFRKQREANPAQRWAWGISSGEVTMSGVLVKAGYRTALIGKWHLGYDERFHPMNYGFDEFRGFVGGNVDYHTHVAGYGLKKLDWWKDRKIENEQGYTTDLLTRHATEFIARNRERPFFLYLTHGAPHDPWQGRDAKSRKPPAETYKEMIAILDESVGAIAAALSEMKLEKNTLLVFCSDNGAAAPPGIAANAPLQGRKGSLLEGGHRVPMIASWPGVIAAGSTNGQPVMSMDFFATFAKLCAAELPKGFPIDGADLMPLFKGGKQQPDRVLHWLHDGSWAVRRGAWKLTGKGDRALNLVDLEKDLGERDNLIKEQAALAEELLDLHRKWAGSVDSR
jgi:arylsulfatase A